MGLQHYELLVYQLYSSDSTLLLLTVPWKGGVMTTFSYALIKPYILYLFGYLGIVRVLRKSFYDFWASLE